SSTMISRCASAGALRIRLKVKTHAMRFGGVVTGFIKSFSFRFPAPQGNKSMRWGLLSLPPRQHTHSVVTQGFRDFRTLSPHPWRVAQGRTPRTSHTVTRITFMLCLSTDAKNGLGYVRKSGRPRELLD